MTRNTGARFGRILCDDEIENVVIAALTDWTITYQAEVERQRGWTPRSLPAPASIIPVALFEKQPEDALPCIAVGVERVTAARQAQAREIGMDWRCVVIVYVSGADEDDTRQRVRAHVAAVRAAMLRHVAGREDDNGDVIVTNIAYVSTDYSQQVYDDELKRTVGAGVIEYTLSTQDGLTTLPGGLRTPPVNPYADPSGLVEVEETNVTVGVQE